ncbi:MAG: hypothetical protein M1818_006643 [Claussenomyces sp. TS43310]|nr:MAG: hypothetical protein M1818_006643 [Claussenomyces sp. TS43310]
MSKVLDQGSTTGLGLHEVVSTLAAVYAAHEPELIEHCDPLVIAWRCGSYVVVPSIIISMGMSLSSQAVGFQSLDAYWGNVEVREDGSVRSAITPGYSENQKMPEEVIYQGSGLQDLGLQRNPWCGPPSAGLADLPLHLSIDRPLHYSEPDL